MRFAPVEVLFVGVLATMAACASPPPKSQFPSARSAIERMREMQACSRALRGEAKLDYFDDQGRIRVKTLFISAHPKNVRFDLLSPFGSPLATLTSNGEAFALLDQEQKAFFVGPARECNVERFLRVPIPPEGLVQLLAGEAPILIHQPEQSTIAWKDGLYEVTIAGKHEAVQSLKFRLPESDRAKEFSAQRLQLVEVLVKQAGVELYRAELQGYAPAKTAAPRVDPEGLDATVFPSGPACQASVPRRIRFIVPISERDVVFDQVEIEHNPPLIDGVFQQVQPGGTTLRRSDCR